MCSVWCSVVTGCVAGHRDLVGVEHVGLGSDFDGTVSTPFDTSQLVQITNGLLQAGLTPDEVHLVMGGNMRRVLLQHLP